VQANPKTIRLRPTDYAGHFVDLRNPAAADKKCFYNSLTVLTIPRSKGLKKEKFVFDENLYYCYFNL